MIPAFFTASSAIVKVGATTSPGTVRADEDDPGAALSDVLDVSLGPAVLLGEGVDPLGELGRLALGLDVLGGAGGLVNLLRVCHGQDATDG